VITLKTYKCPLCKKKYIEKSELYNHIEVHHSEDLVNEITPAQLYFNMRNRYPLNMAYGRSVISRKATAFNDTTERYERFHDEKEREEYRKRFIARMKKKYGKEHLLDDPDHQKFMLASRGISGEYLWRDKKTKTPYTGSYEKDFLEFLDNYLEWDEPTDVMGPAPMIFDYKDKEGKPRFYIPDYYITSLNLIIEIKASDNKHYRERDIEDEHRKDEVLEKQNKYNYMKILDKDYTKFLQHLEKIKEEN
jgi:hypothetical protein